MLRMNEMANLHKFRWPLPAVFQQRSPSPSGLRFGAEKKRATYVCLSTDFIL